MKRKSARVSVLLFSCVDRKKGSPPIWRDRWSVFPATRSRASAVSRSMTSSSPQGVVFALGGEKKFGSLVTRDAPRCSLELGFQPMVWYALRTLENANVLDVFLVAAGEVNAGRFQTWVTESYKGACVIQVVAAPEDADSADALRAVQEKLTTQNVCVVSGDLVTDVSLDDVWQTHVTKNASATCVYAKRRAWNTVETKTGRPPKGATYVGLSPDHHLLFAGDEDDVDKILKLRRPMLRRAPQLTVRTDLLDAQLYVFHTQTVMTLLTESNNKMKSIQLDLVPALARRRFAGSAGDEGLKSEENFKNADADASDTTANSEASDSTELMAAVFGESTIRGDDESVANVASRPCVAYLAPDRAYCVRAETLSPAYFEIARELASADAAAHLLGRPGSKYENFVDVDVTIGAKSTVGPGCIVGTGVVLGEKCSVKRSVVGAGASIGSGVKLINSVVMRGAVVEDGCVIQGSVVGQRAVVGTGTSLRECLVAQEYEVDEGEDFRGETLAEKRH